MKIGFVGTYGTVQELVDLAVDAEEHGWDGYFTWDGVDLDGMPAWDPFAVLAAAAVRTERVTLGALVFALARRRPWVFAKQAVTVDHLSGGRLVLPVGLGVPTDGAVAAVTGEATTLRERAERFDDALAVLDRSFAGERFDVAGTHLRVEGMRLVPTPVARPDGRTRIPLWVVGAFPSERSMGRALRHDGVVAQYRGERAQEGISPQDAAEMVAWVTERRGAGAGPFDVVLHDALPTDRGEASELLAAYEEAGVTWFVDALWDPAVGTADVQRARVRTGPPR
ncbi:Luciferase-like, subgroup [Cellulomonas flavigena DSM 20109]|uniref:Luciferase-like, subgroup n=1 Tax=Cellulomonas flavigena (strain ATCC 482 / DSM 20109 / BCRC 11376 / JCM 18109 / NBRC 3775 / NCIMB 8073 / NRS 134) TaxID=446466 RepID=D5UCV1_CELFN|nr:LLM class flavin-dependent oxidoreductase [Cellulomonas flavigena]ADG76336.1 Luciferase-like, subgroup [Cellulomonas flavigena DSM 20109]